MNWANILRRWTMRGIHGAILGAALLGAVNLAQAQTPAVATTAIPKNYTKSLSFDLPVRIDDQNFQVSHSEIRLYVKAPGSPWKLQEYGPPQVAKFNCRVPHDGEYWYTLVTVDRMGRATPGDVNLEPPSQRVIVDSTAPVIQVQPGNTLDGDLCLRCTVLDANPDHAALKAVCRTELGDIPLEIVPNQPGCFRIKGPEALRFPVIVSARDLAGNIGTKEVSLRDMIGVPPNPSPISTPHKIGSLIPTESRPDVIAQSPAPLFRPNAPSPRFDPAPAPKCGAPGAPVCAHPVAVPPSSLPINSPALSPVPAGNDLPPKLVPPEMTQRSGIPHQLINTTHASIEYRIDKVGPSGVGKVEVYMTPDNGQTWHRAGEDAHKRSPADINLPGDGVYGIRIVVANGNGFGGRTPIRGDASHCTVEVDSTSPFVQLRTTEVLPSSGHVEIRWNATDKNLGSEPMTLSYRTRPDGPWQVIARNVKNDGLYRWAFPRDVGGQFFFKIEVTDQAGNVSQDLSRQPIVIDVTEPLPTVLSVTGSGTPRP